MKLLHSGLFTLIFLVFFVYLAEPIYAKNKHNESDLKSNEVICDEDEVYGSDETTYSWKAKMANDFTLYAASDGEFCLNSTTKKLLIRQCNTATGEWSPPAGSITCAVTQKQRNKFCPEDLIEISHRNGIVCIRLSDDTSIFNESFCYGSDTLFGEKSMKKVELNAILQYLSKHKGITQFWLPVQRASYNRYYNPFVVRLPGRRWGDIYELQNLFTEKRCISANIIEIDGYMNFQKLITNCNESLPMVCVYRSEFVAYSGCPQGFGALAYRPNECYGIEWEAGLFPYDLRSLSIAEYIAKKNSLRRIFYSIDLDRNRFFLIGNFSDEDKTSYDIEMNSEEQLRISPFGEKKHALSFERLTNLNRKSVEMVLSINPELGGLILTIYNRNYIWRFSDLENFGVKCFTNSDSENVQWMSVKIKIVWQNTLETKALFKLKQGKNDGYYWCEAHTIFDFLIVKTEKVAVKQERKGHAYALLISIPCSPIDCFNMFNADVWKRINKNVKKTIGDLKKENKARFEDLFIDKVRLMDIALVENSTQTLRVLIHLSAYLRSFLVDNESSEQSSEEYVAELSSVTEVRMRVLNLLAELISFYDSKQLSNVRSTSLCFPEVFYFYNGEKVFWQTTKYGQTSTTVKLCLHESGVPVTRQCLGEFLWGAFWEKSDYFEDKQPCSEPERSSIITYELRDLEEKKITKKTPSKALENVRQLLEQNRESIIPADFYFISRIMQTTMKTILKDDNSIVNTNTSEEFSMEVARVYNYLMEVNEDVVKNSAILNSTNVLLEAFERLIDEEAIHTKTDSPPLKSPQYQNDISNLSKKGDGINTLQYEDIGVQVKVSSNFIIFILDPYVANVTGVALYFNGDNDFIEKNSEEEREVLQGSFKNEYFRFITSDQSVDDLLYEDNIMLATYVPKTLWNRLDEISRLANITTNSFHSTRFVIKIYANKILFQEHNISKEPIDKIEKKVSGRIVSVSIPGHDKDLPEMLPLIFRVPFNNTENNETDTSCSYWNYDTWENDGLTYLGQSEMDSSVILCGCTHLTPFAYLIGDSYKLSVDSDITVLVKNHHTALDVITVLGCSLSLFGTLGIFVTAAVFQSWRQKASSKVLLQLSGAISLQMMLFCFVNTEENSQRLLESEVFSSCIAIGALLHYSVLVQFSWMIIIGYLQYKRYVQVFGNTRPKRFFKKSSIIGWGAPVIPVSIVLIFDRKSYIPNNENTYNQAICYPSGLSLYLGVIIPITGTIIANLVLFSIIVYNILRGPEGTLRHTEKGLALSQLRLSALLFFLLGFTWIFGLLATLRAGIVFSYLFCLTATLQGFVIFIYFVILDPKTRRMWSGIFINVCGLKESYESSISMKDTIQTLR